MDKTLPIDILNLKQRTKNILKHAGIKTIDQIWDWPKNKFLGIKHLGRSSTDEIISQLIHMKFRENVNDEIKTININKLVDGTRYFIFEGNRFIYSEVDRNFKRF